jgi:hypothetical protein
MCFYMRKTRVRYAHKPTEREKQFFKMHRHALQCKKNNGKEMTF